MLTKMVNGVSVVMSAEEESATRAEWESNMAAAASATTPKLVDAIIKDPAQLAALKAALEK